MENQEFQVREQNSLHKYRTELPNIIEELGLDPYAFRLYAHYKKVAGDGGSCYESKSTLEENLKMSPTTIKDRNRVLSQPFDMLDGKPLIIVKKRRGSKNQDLPVLIEIVDIWNENMTLLSNKFAGKSQNKENNIGVVRTRGGGRQKSGGGSSDAYKEEPIKEEPKENNKETPSAVVVSSVEMEALDGTDLPDFAKLWLLTQHPDKVAKMPRYLSQWKNRDSDLKAMYVIIKRWDTWEYNPTKEESVKSNEDFLKQINLKDEMEIKNHKVKIGKKSDGIYVEFVCGQRVDLFSVSDKDFITDLKEYFKKRMNVIL